jgi:hypothetical protein
MKLREPECSPQVVIDDNTGSILGSGWAVLLGLSFGWWG